MATRTIEAEIKLMGEREFNDQMKALNNNMKNLNAEMKVVTSSFDDGRSATDKLRAQYRLLNQQVEQQEEIVRALTEQYEKQKAELGENEAATDKAKQAMLSAQATLNKYKKSLSDVTEELKSTYKNQNKASDAADKSKSKHSGAASAMDKLTASAKKLGSSLGKVAKELASAAASAAKFTAIGTAKTLAGLGVAASAASLGITALATIGFKKLAEIAISAAQDGEAGFETLTDNIVALGEASNAAKLALGTVLLPALESFTGEGAQLLNDFSEELSAAGSDTEAMGKVMAKYVRKASELLRREGPAFIEAGGGLIKGLTEGIIDNADEIGDAAGELIDLLADTLDENADALGEAAAVLVGTLGELIAENAPELFSAGVSMIESLISGLDGEKLGEQAAELVLLLVETLIELAPQLLTAGLAFIGGLIDGLAEGWPHLKEEAAGLKDKLVQAFKDWWSSWEGIGKDIIEGALAGMQAKWQSVVDWFQSAVSRLRGSAVIDVTYNSTGSTGSSGGNRYPQATGLTYVPYNEYPANLHEGEFVAPKPLANALRAAGIDKNTRSLDGFNSSAPSAVNVSVTFNGSLAQLGRVLYPHVQAESTRVGAHMTGGAT